MRWKRGNRLRLIGESDASPPIRQIFNEVGQSLGVPVVPVLYRAYAAFPVFLQMHWRAFRPVLESRQFFLLGARLAAESYTRAHNYFHMRTLSAREPACDGEALPLAQVLDYYQFVDPLLLLLSAAQMQAFEGPAGQPQGEPEAAQHPTFQVSPRLLSDEDATLTVRRIWDERQRLLELAFVSDEHRAMACWREFYEQYWPALRELLQSPLYADCQYRIGESALRLSRELPVTVETTIPELLEAGLTNEQVASVTRINETLMQALTGLVLDVTFARIACEDAHRTEAVPQKPPATEPNTSLPTRAA